MPSDRDLEARAQELSAIYDNVPGIVFYVAVELDGEFRFVSMSRSGLAAMGLTREQVEGRLVRDVIPPPSTDLVLKHYRDAIQSGRTVRWKEVSTYPSGRRVGEVAVTPLFDANGVATHLIGIVHDITEREALEESLHQREDRLAFLLKLDDLLQPLSDPVERQQAAAKLLADHLQVDRVCYADIGEGYMVRHTYATGAPPSVERGPISPLGAVLLAAYERGRVVAIHDVQTAPGLLDDERATLLGGEVAAFAGVLIEKSKRRKGAFGVHSTTPRTWRPAEVALIRDVAERTWEAVERARAETELREREQRLRVALEASGGGSWTWDVRTNQLDWDPVFRLRYGFADDEPPSFEAWFSRVHEDDRARVSRLLHEVLNSRAEAWDNTFRIVRPGGSVTWIQSLGRADRAADGHVTRVTGLELDVTERRRAEESLRARQDEERDRELRLLLETAAQGIISVDGQGRIIMANRAMETMFGYTNGALIGESIERFVSLWLRVDHGVDLECVGQRQDGSTFPIEVNLNHVATPTGGRAIAFVTDISARKRAESALRERTLELQRRTSQLSQMASDLTLAEQRAREELATTLHDGLQQLLVVSAMSLDQQVLRVSRLGLPTDGLVEAKQLLDEAIAAARSLSVELYPPHLKSAGLPTALNWLANWMHDKYGLKAHVSADARADSTRSDVRTLLFESVRELLFNVVKHAGVDQVDVALTCDANDMLCIRVIDEGVGFDAAGLAERTKTSHVGWGLFSIRERLTLLGGRFEIDSAPGKGTRFCLTAPRGIPSAAQTTHATKIVAAPSESSRPLRILLVDDHAAMRNALRELLHARSELCVVGDASDGLEAIVQAHALNPDVILMDVSMPRMDGVEATRRLRVELPLVQILGLSIHSRTTDLHPIEQAGAAAFFTKGADTRRLVDRLLAIHAEIERQVFS
ncbi:MAG TPA: PAS domain S-box protein, partial [Vicinamibacterales bacterium]|nr:PAS domain S-box protein [Vicinamibacterales bacterium]